MQNLILPIAVVFLSIMLVATLIRESIVKNELLKFRLSLAVIISFSAIAILIFYSHIDSQILIYILSGFVAVIGLAMFSSLNYSIKEKKIKDVYFACVESDNYFVYLDKRNRIKNISKSFAKFLGVDKNEVLKKNFAELLANRYSNLSINDNEYNSDNISKIFSNISSSKGDLKFEIRCLDIHGHEVFLNLIDRPVISSSGKFIAHIIFGKSKSGAEVDKQEESLNEKSTALEMNKLRFRALLEEGNDPLFFYNVSSNSVWANDALVEKLGFSGNSITFDEYKNRIYQEDLSYYLNTFNNLSISHPTYDIKYRFKKGYDYVYVHERGKKIFGPETEVVAVIDEIRTNSYQKTGMGLLDDIKSEEDLLTTLEKFDNVQNYELVCIRLDSIKDINETYGRRMGNLAMNDYISAIIKSFVDNNLIFRTGGLEFYFVITDYKKMENLKRGLDSGHVIEANATYGATSVTIKASMGIVNNYKIKDPKMLIKYAKMSLELTKNQNKKYNFYE